MKKSSLLAYLGFALGMTAMADDTYAIEGRGKVANSSEPPQPTKEPTPFNKQEGIVNLIKDYKLIKSGQSKKGKVKQARIVSKVEAMLEKGQLIESDLN